MARLHLLELEDQAWFPTSLRRYMQDFLSFMTLAYPAPYLPFSKKLATHMQATGERNVVELCAGSGGPILAISKQLNTLLQQPITALATDLHPNASSFKKLQAKDSQVCYLSRPIDATRVPKALKGVRLLCNSFHHFKPELAKSIILDAVKNGSSIAIIEMVNRSPVGLLGIFFAFFLSFLVTPFVKPFSLKRLFFTYALPLVPLGILWDGLVSCLRVYSVAELRELTKDISDYHFDIGTFNTGPKGAYATYLIGSKLNPLP